MSEYFFSRIEDAEYGVYYWPTTLGFTLIAVAMLLFLLLAALLSGRSKEKSEGAVSRFRVKELAFCSIAICLGFVTSNIRLFRLPMGGSVTLFSMLFIALIGYMYGIRTGLTASIAYGLLQMCTNPWIISVPQLLFDYIFAFGALGLSGIFTNKKHGLLWGYLTAVLGRFVFSFISGMVFFGSAAVDYNMTAPVYSLCYNAMYMLPEAVLTVILILIPPVAKALDRIRQMSRS